jgi:folate-binding protein YgfZ
MKRVGMYNDRVGNPLPLRELHLAAGAVIEAPCGWDLPLSYGDPRAEHRAVRSAVGVIDRPAVGVLELTGPDRASFLNGMVSNDVKRLGPGQGCAAAFLDARGRVQTLLAILAEADRHLVILPGGGAAKTQATLEKFHFAERLEIHDASEEYQTILLAGPGTADLVERLGVGPLPGAPWAHAEVTVAGRRTRLVRGGGETGETEAWFLGRRDAGAALWQAIAAAGARPVGFVALDVLRVEAGTPWAGHDADDSTLLPEIPCEPLVAPGKGCYIGQEVVVRIRDRGHVNRRLTGLTLAGESVPRPGARVLAEGREVGGVTSPVWSFSLERPIALAFVRREQAGPGTEVVVADDAGPAPARVTALPFVGRP